MPASRSASPTPARAKCTLWPRSTASRRCAPCWPCSRAWPRARPTAMPAWPTSPPPRSCTWAAAWATAWPTCTTRARAKCPWSTSWATTPPHHTQYDAQLQSDIETVARNVSPGFVRTSQSTAALCQDAADAITAARGLPGQVATLILPADVSWGEGGVPCPPPPPPSPEAADDATVQAIAQTAQAMTQCDGRAARPPCCWAGRRCASPACGPPRASPRTAA
jgi:hypothetical protein